MEFNIVHNIQNIYRKVIKCNSNPGEIISIKEDCKSMDYDTDINKGVLALGLMLLDRETSYEVVSNKEEDYSNLITQLTYGVVDKSNADYILILEDGEFEEIINVVRNSKIGTLIDPHKSATLIFEVASLTNDKVLSLNGPGIEYRNYVDINIDYEILEERNKKNIEFPMGIDCIFVDKDYNVMALPRTTKVNRRE